MFIILKITVYVYSLSSQSKSPVPASEIQKLLADLPMEKTENDPNADKELIKVQRKIK
jgi:hypothetical protein